MQAEIKNRSVRLKRLPAGTQEGLLQQMLEKVVPVKRLEVLQDVGEAVVELENAAVRPSVFELRSLTKTSVIYRMLAGYCSYLSLCISKVPSWRSSRSPIPGPNRGRHHFLRKPPSLSFPEVLHRGREQASEAKRRRNRAAGRLRAVRTRRRLCLLGRLGERGRARTTFARCLDDAGRSHLTVITRQ